MRLLCGVVASASRASQEVDMLRILRVHRTQRVAHVRDGEFLRLLGPGSHAVWTLWGQHELVWYSLVDEVRPISLDDPLPEQVAGASVIEVGPHQRGQVIQDGVWVQTLAPGRYRLWEDGRREVQLVDLRQEPVRVEETLPAGPAVPVEWQDVEASPGHVLVLSRDGRPHSILAQGRWRVWADSPWSLRQVSVASQEVSLAVQELLTQDKVVVRLRPVVHFQVTDPVRWLDEPQAQVMVYTAVQLALREVVVARDLEALLGERELLGTELLQRARAHLPEVGVALRAAAVKDITLPGEVREVLNQVLVARKAAEAEAIRRRQEVASNRQLANTAKLLADHPVLMKLKQLEALAQLAGQIDQITLVSSDEMVRDLVKIES